jgi:acetyltransferase
VTTADPPVEDLEWARRHDIPLLKGSLPGLRALAARLNHQGYLPPPRSVPADEPLHGSGALSEVDSAAVLAAHGVPYVRAQRCASPDEAVAAAERIGYPVVCKIDNVAHKARVGGVALHLADAASVRSAAERMGGRVVVAEQVSGGVEVLVGAVRDPDYGATIVVGIGGSLAEQLDLVAAALAPLDDAGARRVIAAVPALVRLLGGAPPQALIDAVVAVSQLMAEHPEALEIDINPLLVSGERAVALDCLIVLKETE